MDKETYDENIEPKEEVQENRLNRHQGRPFLAYLASGLVGGILVALLIFFLSSYNLFPFQTPEDKVASAKPGGLPISEVLEEEIDPPSIRELSQAIVGVVHLQQQNIWEPSDQMGTGSGIIYKKEDDKAYIVTNNHVVEGAQEVEVELGENERVAAKVLGTDLLTDLAVLEIDSEHVEYVASLGSSDDLDIGEPVLAIGNPISLDFAGTVTKGIISGLDRALKVDTNGDGYPDWITEVIQTDAAINPGNSGGALVNADGKVVGINSMKIARDAVEGIGFAIPIDAALPIMDQLEENGEVVRPFIGVSTVEINQVPRQYQQELTLPEEIEGGMVVAAVEEGSPAAEAKLQQFDILTKIDDQEITSILDLRKYMYSEVSVGDTIKVEFYRDGEQKTVELVLDQASE